MQVVSFFAGCGGLDLGFRQAGFDVVWANEFEPHCRATYLRNHPHTEFVLDDICNIDPDSIPDCDGFIGGPPCQSWSVGGKQKGLDDKRGQLFLKYIALINKKKPQFFVIENVKGMLDEKFKKTFNDFIKELENSGYNVEWKLLDAVNYRIPQNRERVFFVGFRKELNIEFKFPDPTCTEPISLDKAIGDINVEPRFLYGKKIEESVNSFCARKGDNAILYNHDVLISKFGPFYYRGNRRRGWHQPSFTINATAEFAPLHPGSPKMMYYGHENWNFQQEKINEYRRLSVRECARIQTFPDSFVFEYENIKDAYKMIGNAVPPRLAFEIAKSISRALQKNDKLVATSLLKSNKSEIILVGYYKGDKHKQLILKNKIYYVRSDGRPGSMFKKDCPIVPHYVLMHHKDEYEFYQLDGEEPILTDRFYLKSLGFKVSGEQYLLFRLKDTSPVIMGQPSFDDNSYVPHFIDKEKLIKE